MFNVPRQLWSPFMIEMEKRQRERDTERLRSKPRTKWSPDLKLPKYKHELLFLDAGSFQGWVDDQARQLGISTGRASKEEIGDWTLDWVEIPTDGLLSLWKSGRVHGGVGFSHAVWVPRLKDEDGDIWMSLTPAEILSLRAGLRGASGTVVVGGLGMGWFARQLAVNPRVRSLMIVDTRQELLDRFGKPLVAEFPGKVTLKHGDFYEIMQDPIWGTVPGLRVLADIWPSVGDHLLDDRWGRLKDKLSTNNNKPFLWAW